MKETGILMSTPMVKATLEDRKTCTRRIMLPQPEPCRHKEVFGEGNPGWDKPPDWQGNIIDWVGYKYEGRQGWFCQVCGIGLKFIDEWSGHGIICPYGQVGDLLYVRETFYTDEEMGNMVIYKADSLKDRYNYNGPWNPSIFMPKWAARIWLEITGVRAERLQGISAKDAIAEGIEYRDEEWMYVEANGNKHLLDSTTPQYKRYDGKGDDWTRCPQLSFRTLWNSLNAERGYGWDTNPWVWVIDYKRIEK